MTSGKVEVPERKSDKEGKFQTGDNSLVSNSGSFYSVALTASCTVASSDTAINRSLPQLVDGCQTYCLLTGGAESF